MAHESIFTYGNEREFVRKNTTPISVVMCGEERREISLGQLLRLLYF